MITKLKIFLTFIILCCSLSSSFAYFTIKGGASKLMDLSTTLGSTDSSIHHKLGINFSIAGGWRINRNSRFEIEVATKAANMETKTEKTNGRTSVYEYVEEDNAVTVLGTFMVNWYYDFITKTRFSPYFGAGIGSAAATFQHRTYRNTYSYISKGYQAMLGVNFAATKSTLILLQYQLLGTSKSKLDRYIPEKTSLYANSLSLGVTFFA